MHLLSIALAPIILILVYIYGKDYKAKEPMGQLIKAFILGAVGAILLTLIFTSVFEIEAAEWDGIILSAFGQSFLEAAVPEELSKWLLFLLFFSTNKHFDEYFDGIVYAVYIGIGFACTENILYVLDGGIGTGYMRALTAVPGHFLFAVTMGYYSSLYKFESSHKAANFLKSIVMPILAHGIYDMIIFLIDGIVEADDAAEDDISSLTAVLILVLTAAFIAFIVILWKRGLKHIREMRNKDGAEENKIIQNADRQVLDANAQIQDADARMPDESAPVQNANKPVRATAKSHDYF